MRTTSDIPEDLLKRAKIEAVQRGTTLRELVGVALERELTAAARGATPRRRRQFLIFESKAAGALRLTSARIAALETDENKRCHDRARRRQRAGGAAACAARPFGARRGST